MAETVNTTYNDDAIQTLEWNEHIRRRAGMYIGRLGNGDRQGDGIYVLLKEIIDNSIDEFSMGFGKRIDITIEDKTVTVGTSGAAFPLTKWWTPLPSSTPEESLTTPTSRRAWA